MLAVAADVLVPQFAADWLMALCRCTGQFWGPKVPSELFWYRPPKVHILEFFILHIFAWWCISTSRGYFTRVLKAPFFVSQHRRSKSKLNRFLSLFLFFCWLLQVSFKMSRKQYFVQLFWMLMPCHLLTLFWALVLWRGGKRHYKMNVCLATIAVGCSWGPVAAVMFPDFGDYQFKIERYVFVIQHGALIILPFYFVARYELLPMSVELLLYITGIFVTINGFFYTICSYVSGLNINYMLYPPLKLINIFPFTSIAYRFYVILLLMLLTVFFYFVASSFGKCAKLVFTKWRVMYAMMVNNKLHL